jgi:hypothetical protein
MSRDSSLTRLLLALHVSFAHITPMKTDGVKKGMPFCNPCEKVIPPHDLDAAIRVSHQKWVTKLEGKVMLKCIASSFESLKKRFDDITDLMHGHSSILS